MKVILTLGLDIELAQRNYNLNSVFPALLLFPVRKIPTIPGAIKTYV